MPVNKTELITALSRIKPGLSNTNLTDLSSHVIFNDDKLCAYSDNVWVLCPFQSGIIGAVRDKELYGLLSKLTEEKIQMTIKDNQLQIRQKKLKAGFPIETELEKIPPDILNPEIGEKEWKKLPSNFIEAISFCMFSAATDISMGALTNLALKKDKVYSCDNYRAVVYQLDSAIDSVLQVPVNIAKHLINFSMNRYFKKENAVYFCNDKEVVFAYQDIDEEYPDISKLFQVEGDSIQLPKELKSSLIRSEIFAGSDLIEEKDSSAELILKENQLICHRESDVGWIEEINEIKYAGEEIRLRVVPKYLYQVLDKMSNFIIGQNCILFQCDQFQHVIALID